MGCPKTTILNDKQELPNNFERQKKFVGLCKSDCSWPIIVAYIIKL